MGGRWGPQAFLPAELLLSARSREPRCHDSGLPTRPRVVACSSAKNDQSPGPQAFRFIRFPSWRADSRHTVLAWLTPSNSRSPFRTAGILACGKCAFPPQVISRPFALGGTLRDEHKGFSMADKNTGTWIAIALLTILFFAPIFAGMRGCMEENTGPSRWGRRSDLSQIGKAIQAYMAFNGDYLPPSLWSLYPRFIDDAELLASPEGIGQFYYLFEGSPAYVVPFATVDMPVVLWVQGEGPDLSGTVLHWDGHVSRVDVDELTRMMADIPARWKRESRGEGDRR
jgi:hypothetical protein